MGSLRLSAYRRHGKDAENDGGSWHEKGGEVQVKKTELDLGANHLSGVFFPYPAPGALSISVATVHRCEMSTWQAEKGRLIVVMETNGKERRGLQCSLECSFRTRTVADLLVNWCDFDFSRGNARQPEEPQKLLLRGLHRTDNPGCPERVSQSASMFAVRCFLCAEFLSLP